MRLVQFLRSDGRRGVGTTKGDGLRVLSDTGSTYELIMKAIRTKVSLKELVWEKTTDEELDLHALASENRLLPPLDHPDAAHCFVTGTGLNHLGSAMARNAMHSGTDPSKESDSMKMFKMGMDGGKPTSGRTGVQPEWFYKGDGSCVVPPGQPLELPSFALDGGEEAELVGLYVISDLGEVFRVGFALGNEYSDHVLERQNYLYLAHSKLRDCSIGPELLVGALPESVSGTVKVTRGGETIWSSLFLTGEANMTHSLSNLEYHLFKYRRFRRPGDVHCHFLGASVLSFSSGVRAKPGDEFEISSPEFGYPLKNSLGRSQGDWSPPHVLTL